MARVPLVTVTVSGARTASAGTGATVTSIDHYFAWIQTAGPATVLIGDASGLGVPVMSGTAAGEVEDWIRLTPEGTDPSIDNMQVGVVLMSAADTQYAMVDLMLKW